MEKKIKSSDLSDTWKFIKKLQVEPFVFLAVLSYHLKSSVSRQLVQDKVCMTELGLAQGICYNVTSTGSAGYEDMKDEILKRSGDYDVYSKCISAIPGLIYALFLGSWIDKFPSGPKILMLATSFGVLLDLIIDMVIGIYFEIPTPYTLLSTVPSTLLGGVFSLFTAIYSHAVRTTSRDMLVMRFAVLEIMMGTAQPLSTFLPSRLIHMTPWFFPDKIRNYVGVYTVTICTLIPAMLWAYFFIDSRPTAPASQGEVEEHEMGTVATSGVEQEKKAWHEPLKSAFDLHNVKSMVNTFLKSRPDNDHLMLWFVTFCQTLSTLAMMGEGTVQYLFVQKHFNWNFSDNGDVSTLFSVLRIFVPLLVVPLLIKKLKLSLPMMGLIGSLLSVSSLIVRGVFITEYGFYASLIVSLPSSIAGTALSTYSMQLISPDEVGSIMSIKACIFSVVPLLNKIIFINLFKATLNTNPGACYFLSAILSLPVYGLFTYLQACEMRKATTTKL